MVVIIAAAAAGGFLWWKNKGTDAGSETLGIYAQRVGDVKYSAGAVSSYSGVVESQETLEVNKDSDKEIEEIYVAVGDEVKEGDPLFKYDVDSVKQQKQTANLELEGLQTDLEGYQAQVNQLTAEKQAAPADGQVDYTRRDYRVPGPLDEQRLYSSGLSEGMQVIIRSRADETVTWTGSIKTIDTENPQSNNNNDYSDSSSDNSASKYPFYIQLDSSDGLMLGQHVYIEPDYGQGDVKTGLWLDASYVLEDDGTYVWALDSRGRLEKRQVEIGDRDDDLYLVQIASGLSDDDYIVWPSDDLYVGMKVTKYEDVDWDAYNSGVDDSNDEGIYDEGGTEYLEGGTECVDESVYGTEFTDDTASDDLNGMFGSTSNDTEVE